MELVQSLNLGVRFLLELGALVAFGYWGYQSGQGPLRFALAVGLPIVAAIIWGVFVAPNASVVLPDPAKFVLGLTILSLAAASMFRAGAHTVSAAFVGCAHAAARGLRIPRAGRRRAVPEKQSTV